MTENPKSLFEDLGKATLRGVRKCPKCGIFNGTRCMTCKNKNCGMVFKIPKEKMATPEIDGAKILCKSDLQIYSVKLQQFNDSLRCFVHLPIIEGIEALKDAEEVKVIKQSAAMCYAPSCRKPMDDMGTITLNLNPCIHTQFIVDCSLQAQPLEIKKGVVKVFPLSEEVRQEISAILSETDEHLVQRITKNTLVVKCSPQIKHPLGFLHISVYEPVRNSKRFKILCECQNEFIKPFVPKGKQMCLHFYLCIFAIASDTVLIEEFKLLVQCVLKINTTDTRETSKQTQKPDTDLKFLKAFFSDGLNTAKRKKNDKNNVDLEEIDVMKTVKILKTESILTKQNASDSDTIPIPSINFEQWLASVTEHINQTMHYQFSGSPEPLVFHVPQVFFDSLQQRISTGTKKKRLPNTVVAFTRKTSLPVGIFSKYTWHITNILHVKRIFDTEQVPLEITRSFIENRDGTYTPYNPMVEEIAKLAENYQKTMKNSLIKPLELKTFLKVGNMALNQKEPTPFIIEWTPDILPKTHVGELRIKFEYGHQRNGKIENHETATKTVDNINLNTQSNAS